MGGLHGEGSSGSRPDSFVSRRRVLAATALVATALVAGVTSVGLSRKTPSIVLPALVGSSSPHDQAVQQGLELAREALSAAPGAARRGLPRASASVPTQPTGGIDVAAALARTTTQELGALAALAARCAEKLEPTHTGTTDRTEGGAQ